MINKFRNGLIIVGSSLCLLYVAYTMYIAGVRWAAAKVEEANARGMTIASIISIVEGEVVSIDNERMLIEYYYEWDGAYYRTVRNFIPPTYYEGAKAMVVCILGMGSGSCLVVGLYSRYVQICGVIGLLLVISGIMIKRKGKVTWQEEKL